MGNAAGVQAATESSRRRLLIQQYNQQPHALVSKRLEQALQPTQADQGLIALHELFEVLHDQFHVPCTMEQLPRVLLHLGCKAVPEAVGDKTVTWISYEEVVAFLAPRKKISKAHPPGPIESNGLTIWQAAKAGHVDTMSVICGQSPDAYRSLDAFGNTPLYYASLCGREVVVDFLMRQYEVHMQRIPDNELLRCVTNALNAGTRALLQHKTTLAAILATIKSSKQDDEAESGGFAWLMNDDDE